MFFNVQQNMEYCFCLYLAAVNFLCFKFIELHLFFRRKSAAVYVPQVTVYLFRLRPNLDTPY